MGEEVMKLKYDLKIMNEIFLNNGSDVELGEIFGCKWELKIQVSQDFFVPNRLDMYLIKKSGDTELSISSRLIVNSIIENYGKLPNSNRVKCHVGGYTLTNMNKHTRFDLVLRFEKTKYDLKCLDEVYELPVVSMIQDIPPITSTYLIIKCKDGRGVEVSKLKISERSAYFCSLFLPDELGGVRAYKDTRIFDMSFIPIYYSYNSICAMVIFLYTGKVNIGSMQLARELICLANEFVIKGLKEAVEDYLMSNLIVDAVEIFKIADTYKLKIKEKVMLFIGSNIHYFDTLDCWKKFKTEKPSMVSEITTYRTGIAGVINSFIHIN